MRIPDIWLRVEISQGSGDALYPVQGSSGQPQLVHYLSQLPALCMGKPTQRFHFFPAQGAVQFTPALQLQQSTGLNLLMGLAPARHGIVIVFTGVKQFGAAKKQVAPPADQYGPAGGRKVASDSAATGWARSGIWVMGPSHIRRGMDS